VRRDVAQSIVEIIDRGERGALATVVRAAGSTPQVPGAKVLLRTDGTIVGTVGGGRIEEVVLETLRQVLADGEPQSVRRHLAHDLGMCCGGEMELFCELVEGHVPLVVFGAGHVGRALVRLAEVAGFAATVVDPREELLTADRFPHATRLLLDPAEAIGRLALHEGTFVVITTHDHVIDEETLARCLPLPHRYLGMIGSRRKVIRVYQRLRHKGLAESFASVSAPVGLDIGAVTPEEIAVSIVAEMVGVRRGGSGARLGLGEKADGLSKPPSEGEG
jgi:xanthine dehydrogenase accessory factor